MNAHETWWQKTARAIFVAVFTAVIVLGLLQLIYGSRSAREEETQQATKVAQEQARDATLALACELALPVDPELGRDEADVVQCFTQYDLEPPILHDDNG